MTGRPDTPARAVQGIAREATDARLFNAEIGRLNTASRHVPKIPSPVLKTSAAC